MKSILVLVAVLLCFSAVFATKQVPITDIPKEHMMMLNKFLPYNVTGKKYCPTEDVWAWKKALMNDGKIEYSPLACATEGTCDTPSVRDSYADKNLQVQLYVTVLCKSTTSCPSGITQTKVNQQLTQMNKDFAGTGISFTIAETKFYTSSAYNELDAYGTSNNWYNQLRALKNLYAVSPTKYLNVFITGQKSGSFGTLLGIGTFPWDSEAKTNYGGLWVNAAFVGSGQKTASHEGGHNLGLWHTFHGDSEVSCNSGCYETVHPINDEAANKIGDFCADTASQPMNYVCSTPTGSDCKGNSWTKYGATLKQLTDNIMAYTPDSCMQSFTQQQASRSKCWLCNALPNWVSGC